MSFGILGPVKRLVAGQREMDDYVRSRFAEVRARLGKVGRDNYR
jgi:hypothetical protein